MGGKALPEVACSLNMNAAVHDKLLKGGKMKKVIIDNSNEIHLSGIHKNTPIFAKENGKLIGMIIQEDKGWILRIGGNTGAYGHFGSRDLCLSEGRSRFNYEFYIEEK